MKKVIMLAVCSFFTEGYSHDFVKLQWNQSVCENPASCGF